MKTLLLFGRLLLVIGLILPELWAQTPASALVRGAPVINGRGEGSLHIMSPENLARDPQGMRFVLDLKACALAPLIETKARPKVPTK